MQTDALRAFSKLVTSGSSADFRQAMSLLPGLPLSDQELLFRDAKVSGSGCESIPWIPKLNTYEGAISRLIILLVARCERAEKLREVFTEFEITAEWLEHIENLRLIAPLPNVREITISEMKSFDLPGLEAFPKMTELTFNSLANSDLACETTYPKVKSLIIIGSKHCNLCGGKDVFPNLTELKILETKSISGVGEFSGHPVLKTLHLESFDGKDLSPIGFLPALLELSLNNHLKVSEDADALQKGGLESLQGIESFPELKRFMICQVRDLSALQAEATRRGMQLAMHTWSGNATFEFIEKTPR